MTSSPRIAGVLDDAARAARSRRAVDAAVAIAREARHEVHTPKVLYDMFSVVVHLAPADLVARIPTVLLPSDAQAPSRRLARQARELAVVRALHAAGFPVVPPSSLITEPKERDGFCMTFWPYVEQSGAEIDAEVMTLTAQLHAAMAKLELPVSLPFLQFWSGIEEELGMLADQPELLSPEELQRARDQFAALDPLLSSREAFQKAFPQARLQPIHGDSPIANATRTEDGLIIGDFELTNIGPVEIDLAGVPPELLAPYEAEAGRSLDPRLVSVMSAAGLLAGVAALAFTPQLPSLVEPLMQTKAYWLSMPSLELP
jgi:aminoglycoside phosphotransferase (APT) family kinase protein